jgi:hypothetical protein
VSALALLVVVLQASAPDESGLGWRLRTLDVVVTVVPEERLLHAEGELELELADLERSSGPTLAVGGEGPVMTFTHLDAERCVVREREVDFEGTLFRVQDVRASAPFVRGDRVRVAFACESAGSADQLVIHADGALASWTESWLPHPLPRIDLGAGFTAALASATGTTTFELPPGWRAISDGERIAREESADGVREVWELATPLARSFCAGPYAEALVELDGGSTRVLMRDAARPIDPPRLARILADARAAMEARFGPLPSPSYGVVEIPASLGVPWYAASHQSFITAGSSAFDWEHGNLPLWAHEMAHGWWGNAVGTTGPGSLWCGESLAQLGALLAIETLEGPAAAREFLGYSRSGYSDAQCAMGYFWIWRQGGDRPLAELDDGRFDHDLSDSKGLWVWHMLRREVGDERFFATLRELYARFAGRELSVGDVRAAFVTAAPDAQLERFFAQWLDRTGAPVVDLRWRGAERGTAVALELEQLQPGEPFAFPLELELLLLDGTTVRHVVPIDERLERVQLPVSKPIEDVRLDPDFEVLLHRPGYGPSPVEEPPLASGR